MLVATTRYHITEMGSNGIMIDELRLVKNCTVVALRMFSAIMYRDLLTVRDPTTKFLAEAISRGRQERRSALVRGRLGRMKNSQSGKDILVVMRSRWYIYWSSGPGMPMLLQ